MIVRRHTSHAVHLITQPDHARLARTIMERCVPLIDHPRRDAILHAIAEHDNGWTEEDAEPAVDPATGDVADFIKVPVRVRQRVWPRGVARLAARWPAALVAHHAVTVYDRFRRDSQWTSFFAEMEAARDDRVRQSGLTHDDLLADYPFVRLGDLASLAFCTASTDEQRFAPWTVKLAGSRVTVTPSPFAGSTVDLEIVAREIRTGPFQSDAELRAAVREAPSRILRGQVA
jgi:uncharacterized protein DUF3891